MKITSHKDAEHILKTLSSLEGVRRAEFTHLNSHLHIEYDGRRETASAIFEVVEPFRALGRTGLSPP